MVILLYKKRHQLAIEFEKWCKENNTDSKDTTNVISWLNMIDLLDTDKVEKFLEEKNYLTYDDIMRLQTIKIEDGIRSSIIYKVKLGNHIYNMYLNQLVFSREMSLHNDEHDELLKVYIDEKHKDFINNLSLELVEVVEEK